MAEKVLWKTKPVECWTKFKEIARERYTGDGTTTTTSNYRVQGFTASNYKVAGGGEGYAANCANMGLTLEFRRACEGMGYARDLCAYSGAHLGSIFTDKYAFGGSFPKPDLVKRGHTCDTHAKWALIEAEHYGVPFFATDGPLMYEFDSEQTRQNKMDYMVAQELESIEWQEKHTGERFDDEAYIRGLYNNFRSRNLWAQVCILNQNIPAPLDQKSIFSLFVIPFFQGARDECAQQMEILRDEVEDRVKNHIAAVPTERYRFVTTGIPPWHALNTFRYLEKYGAVSVACRYSTDLGTNTTMVEGGREVPIPTLEERGIVLKTREEAIRCAIERRCLYVTKTWRFCGHQGQENDLRQARLWQADGALLHYNRGCEQFSLGLPQIRQALLEHNYDVLIYEGSSTDPRDIDQIRTFDRIDTLMESRGLEKLND
ncbi:MAG: 2-hydroxyacyl-CoA dehydratase [Chloroflexi bacterium]|nr:2-hydroxyacyl-CoA dehydratase [Chloroflexota bacterium]MBI3930426.1 2-hydroxyacyl-CoA dehydratase [Chloroflexota bacterium]